MCDTRNATKGALVEEARRMMEAAAKLRDLLHFVIHDGYGHFAGAIEAGVPLEEAMRHAMKETSPRTVSAAVAALEAQRTAFRTALLRCWLDEGGTVSEFAQINGFSRQYVQKLAREAK